MISTDAYAARYAILGIDADVDQLGEEFISDNIWIRDLAFDPVGRNVYD